MKPKLDELGCYLTLRKIRWPKGILCPYCGQKRVTMHTKSTRTPRRRYLCLGCRRTFTDLTATPFARTNLPLHVWLLSVRLIGELRLTSDLAKALHVKWDTAARIQRRLVLPLNRPGFIRRLRDVLKDSA